MSDGTDRASRIAPPTADARLAFGTAVRSGEIVELSHVMDMDMPVYPVHVPYKLTLDRRHGDPHARSRIAGSSFANEIVMMASHTSTHIDALGHFSRCGHVHGGVPAHSIETSRGLSSHDAQEIGPIWRQAVLFDLPRSSGVESLQPAEEITPQDLEDCASAQGIEIEPGDLVLIRTGWALHWRNSPRFNGSEGGLPGPGRDGTQWLLDRGASMVGSDTPAFEVIPSVGDSVHCMLLVDRAIHIIENLDLEALAARRTRRFLFVGLPLRMAGATGSPMRPIAIL
ncbi:MAG: cyclase family protein [Burkholderiaceae bacterium]